MSCWQAILIVLPLDKLKQKAFQFLADERMEKTFVSRVYTHY